MAEMPNSEVNFSTQQHRLVPFFLLVYRWVSLVPALWLFVSTTGPVTPNAASVALLVLATSITLIVTITENFFNDYSALRTPFLLGLDLLFMAMLLALSGAGSSLYTFHALSPLLAGAFFFQLRGAFLAASVFSIFYLVTLGVVRQFYPVSVELSQLFTQFAGAWLVTVMFGSLSLLLNQLPQVQDALTSAYNDLTRRDAELKETHKHLGVIHDLTLSLQASDSQSVQHRLLNAVTKELGFSRAVIGLVNHNLQRLENWQASPAFDPEDIATAQIALARENGLVAQAVLNQHARWCPKGETLIAAESINDQLGHEDWLILPLIWQDRAVGVLLDGVNIAGESGGRSLGYH